MSAPRQKLRIALPKGRLLDATSRLLNAIGLGFTDYTGSTRAYTFNSSCFPGLGAKMLQEKDIPIQVAVGNYDLGICGLDWVEEQVARYPGSKLFKVAGLGYGGYTLYAAGSRFGIASLDDLDRLSDGCRIVSEYPNLAESFALSARLRRFRIFPVWGGADVYPPESADFVVLREKDEAGLEARGLVPIKRLLTAGACLIANSESWEKRDLSELLALFRGVPFKVTESPAASAPPPAISLPQWRKDAVWLALPDGHQQKPAAEFLKRAGIDIDDYGEGSTRRRLSTDGIDIKVIRPQDMPQQVANGNFDLAVTGLDWVLDHLARFPSSPIMKLADFGFGKVRIVAAMSRDLPVRRVADLRQLIADGKLRPVRVCSEYTNIADKYLWDHHLSPYRLIPTWGASEAFLPDDADMLIDNTETGSTLERQRLEIIDTLFESSACLIGRKDETVPPVKRRRIAMLVESFTRAVENKP